MWKLLLLAVGALAYDPELYNGYKSVIFEPKIMKHMEAMSRFAEGDGAIKAKHNEMLISPERMNEFKYIARGLGMDYEITSKDIASEMREEWNRMLARGYPNMAYDINDYNTLTDIYGELTNLAGQCASGITCTVSNIGTTIEGRDHKVFKLSGGTGRTGIMIDSLIHAREWLAGATGMNILDKMVKEYTTDTDVARLLDAYDFYFISVNNPDGYEYSWTGERGWRKNRRDNVGSTCDGVDLNRNYDWNWSGPGASNNPCADDYYGSSANSEPETTNIVNFAGANPSINADVSLHCYGYYLLAPYGDCSNPPGWTDDVGPVMNAYCDALEAYEPLNQWACGNSCEVLYATSGGSTDYLMDTAGMKYTFVTECRGNGFVEAPSQIPLSFEENWAGLVAMVDEMIVQAGPT